MRHPFLRTLAGSAATPTDANFENVTLLLHGDGTNGGQNNTFVDGSTNNFSITRNGNTTQGTFSPYGDNWSNYFDGTGDYLTCGNNAALGLGSGDYTVEYWIFLLRAPSSGSFWAPIDLRGTGGSGWTDYIPDTGLPTVFVNTSPTAGNNVVASTIAVTYNAWTHIAYVRSGTTTTVYVNGASGGSATDTNNYPAPASSGGGARIGINKDGNGAVPGYISNVRIVKGTAVYTAAFTPSTAPLTSITNTSLLTCQSNRFRDASTNNFTITRNGDVSVQRFSPFSPTAAYAAGTIGGSGQSDGSGDYLTVADNTGFHFGSGNFTIEAWVYLTDNQGGTTKSVTSKFEGNAGTGPWALWIQATTLKPRFYVNYGAGFENRFLEGSAVDVASWCHLAVVRNGSTITLYQNGTSTATLAVSTNSLYVDSGVVVVLDDRNFTRNLKGGISDLRIIKGSAAYTSNFTPPTSPLTAITNTSLLLKFQNAAILNNAMMSDLETVGNAQIDTTTKKFGTGSLKFDGTGDWLLIADSPNLNMGTGDFTIEAWVNRTSAISGAFNSDTVVGKGSNNIIIGISTSTNVFNVANYGVGSLLTGTTAVSNGTWYHVAVTRSGTTMRLFVNGTQEASTTSSANFSSTSVMGIGVDPSFNTQRLNGYIDDLRITKGFARYTANFTAPTAAFPDL